METSDKKNERSVFLDLSDMGDQWQKQMAHYIGGIRQRVKSIGITLVDNPALADLTVKVRRQGDLEAATEPRMISDREVEVCLRSTPQVADLTAYLAVRLAVSPLSIAGLLGGTFPENFEV